MYLIQTKCCTPFVNALAEQARIALAVVCLVTSVTVQAAETLEMQAAAGGPAINADPTASQTVTLRRNIDNPAGNTFAPTAAPVTVTYSLANQRFPGPGTQTQFGASFAGIPPYGSMGGHPAALFTSTGVGGATGVGIDTSANGMVILLVRDSGPRLQGLAPNGRHAAADLTLTFSRPVDNPVVHVSALGGSSGAKAYTAELDLISAGTLTRLSGASDLSVTGNQINNDASAPFGNACTSGELACGSVRINGTGLTTVTFTLALRGAGPGPWVDLGADSGDGFGIGVSVDLPPQVTLVAQSYGTSGDYSYTGTNGYAGHGIQTNATGTLVAASKQTLTVATPTIITESIVQGPPLTAVSCVTAGNGAPVAATVDLVARTVALNAGAMGAAAQVQCTFTHGSPSSAESIPTLGQWGLALLSVLMVAFGALRLRRR